VEYNNILILERKGKQIIFLLGDGESLSLDNIVDVLIHDQPERLNNGGADKDGACDSLSHENIENCGR
jgi:hypothetical protein